MPNYQNSKIYKIVCDEEPELVYYGSTCERLSNRMSSHRSHYKLFMKGGRTGMSCFQITKYPSANIVLVENYPCNSKEELHARERWFIENNTCVNKQKPGNFNSKGSKIYQAEYQAEYRQTNKEAFKAKLTCECGKEYTRKNKSQHQQTAKHIHSMEIKALTDEVASMMLIDAPTLDEQDEPEYINEIEIADIAA